ncbi:MAG: hypothetical protein ACRDI2_22175 [Chloroflexota bacterium]
MYTYRTLDGRVLDLTGLDEEQRAYFERCYTAYLRGTDFLKFSELVDRKEHNPLLRPTDGWITREIYAHPLFQAVRDLEFRLEIQQDVISPDPGDDLGRDPVADEWIPAVEAAQRKGVSLPGLHKAIRRGDVIARQADPARSWLVVSANSLATWSPNPRRQAAQREARTAGARSPVAAAVGQ